MLIGLAPVFQKKMSIQQSWQNVYLGLGVSNERQLSYITFFPKYFFIKNIIGIYLNILSLFWCLIVMFL